MVNIRIANYNDVEGIVSLSRIGWDSIIHVTHINEHVFKKNLFFFIFDMNYLILVAEDTENNNKIVGCFCGRVVQTYWSNDWAGEGVGVYILDEYRGKGIANEFYHRYNEWCEGFKRVKNIRYQTSSGKFDPERFFNKMGFNKIGGIYNKEVNRLCV